MQALIWNFVCVLIPLVGINYALRMILLSFLPAGVGDRRLSHREPARNDASKTLA